ncbi:MAG: hypothetical protein RW306_07095 [Geobacteraceae bacterium]|nr:hypothetical protein [Geobacteraceae bacterium]
MRMTVVIRMTLLASACLLMAACSSNFMVYKQGRHFYVTSTGQELKAVLCDSGDLKRILGESKLNLPLQNKLDESICGTGKVRERVLAVLEEMSREERSNLKVSFQAHGYDINHVANC